MTIVTKANDARFGPNLCAIVPKRKKRRTMLPEITSYKQLMQ
jgi:hypothetical protein